MAGEDRPYISWLHEQECAVQPCSAKVTEIEASHGRTARARPSGKRLGGRPGKAQRSHDHAAYPVCSRHHGQLQRYEYERLGIAREDFATWERDMAAKYLARYREECEQFDAGTLPEAKLVTALRRRGFDAGDFAARWCAAHGLGAQLALDLGRDLKRELKEGGVPL